ncbi:MAG TPA: hypothetical protein VK610_05455 [Rhodothermales bacterium]|nr:hypothetical protein [Rhodothermales bacterium]
MNAPALSIVLVAPSGARTIGRTMRCLRAQTAADRLEVLIVAPEAAGLDLDALGGGCFHALRVVEAGPIERRGSAAALGVRAATAPLVGLVEDHSFPEPGWAEAFIKAHEGPWAAVGPAVENANPGPALSWAVFAVTYGSMSGPLTAGERDLLPWHNSTYKRAALAPYWADLDEMLHWEGFLQLKLREAGGRLYLEPAARTHHQNVSRLPSALALNAAWGRVLGADRAERGGWTWARRLLYGVAWPLFPLMQLRGLVPQVRRLALPTGLLLRLVPALALTLAARAVGEALGYLAGPGHALESLEDYELHRHRHLSRRDLDEAAHIEATATA